MVVECIEVDQAYRQRILDILQGIKGIWLYRNCMKLSVFNDHTYTHALSYPKNKRSDLVQTQTAAAVSSQARQSHCCSRFRRHWFDTVEIPAGRAQQPSSVKGP